MTQRHSEFRAVFPYTSGNMKQRGMAMLVLLLVLIVTAVAFFAPTVDGYALKIKRDKITAAALAQAKDALIAFAARNPTLPGGLPCPDTNNDGSSDPCGTAGKSRIGRLPWKTLGIPDLRDADGECLWYAVSGRFKNIAGSTINSDRNGQFIVLANDGITFLAGSTPETRAIAVIFAPGRVVNGQNRSSAGTTVCGGNNTAANYLDALGAVNNSVVSGTANATSTFIAGDISDIFSDRLLFITPEQFFPAVEARVAREARYCVNGFSLQPGANNRFPWAAPLTDITNFADANTTQFGRIPRTLAATNASLGNPLPPLDWTNPGGLTTGCFLAGSWWDSWREHLFYHVSLAYKPSTVATGACPANCLTVNTTNSVKAVVIVAGRAWGNNPNQSGRQTSKTSAASYLETDPVSGINNASGGGTGTYAKNNPTSTGTANFNDKTECLHVSGAGPCQ